MFKRKQEPFHNAQIIAMFLIKKTILNDNNGCSEHSVSFRSKDTLLLAILKASFSRSANQTQKMLLHLI